MLGDSLLIGCFNIDTMIMNKGEIIMKDLINRKDLLEAFEDDLYEYRHPIIQKFENRVQAIIKEIPSIKSPKGEWIEVERKGSIRKFYKCSLCGGTCYFPNVKQSRPRGRFKYCPYCGADMREK